MLFYFSEQSLFISQVGLVIYLDHDGEPCSNGGYIQENITGDVEEEWEDEREDGCPPHLAKPSDRSYLTVVHTNGVHFCDIQFCS